MVRATVSLGTWLLAMQLTVAAPVNIDIATPMAAPRWALLQRQLLAENMTACQEFFRKYYDDRGYLQAFLRWGANDGPDDAFENFNRWPELHALGADDEILRMMRQGLDGMIRQYSEAKTTDVPAGRRGMYVKEYSAQSDWMHHGEGLQLVQSPRPFGSRRAALRGTRAPVRRLLHGRGPGCAELRRVEKTHSLDDQRQYRPDAPEGDSARLGGRSIRRRRIRRAAW
jgi:hypothetical protein